MLLAAAFSAGAASEVRINEFMAANAKTLSDQDGEFSDWIEIYNAGPDTVNLDGWYLTDSAELMTKWRFPAINLAANAYLLLFASGKDRAIPGAQLHANFALDAAGEYLALVQPDGLTVASEFAPGFPEQFPDISYGLSAGTNVYFSTPTPGGPNGAGLAAAVADTKFSPDRGFYSAPFSLVISTETPGATIHYTTNGTMPTATTGIVYTGPIPISGTTVVRAAAFLEGYLPSNVDTQTYIFLDDVIRQSSTGQPPPGWPSSWGANTRDYGMDPDVVNSPLYSATIKNDLITIPSFSLVMKLDDLFNASTGIYANAGQQGITWERPASLELIFPNATKGFQNNCGIRIRGGYSRSPANPKHAFRVFFRQRYGAGKLNYPLFGPTGADSFDGFDIRTFQNYSWSFEGDPRGVFIRDVFSRDTQLAMGQPAERGDYYHLYINGQYWGLYNSDERPEASYAASYFGGNKEDYDVIKVETGPYTIRATDGNMQAWTRLYNICKAGITNNAAYFRIQGKNPDGTPNPDYENLIDVDNLIDYMLVIVYGGNLDAPISNFLGNNNPNNWYGFRNRNGTHGFRFVAHDSEHTLLSLNENRMGPYPAGNSSVLYSSPQWVWQKLWTNTEFRILAADHIHRHFFNGGALTPQAAIDRFMKRKNEIDRAVVGESARWGDAKRATPLTRDKEWLTEVNRIVNSYLPQRSAIVLNQLKSKGLYPNIVAPSFNQHGGIVSAGFQLIITAPAGTAYYTLNNTDPRQLGGAISGAALAYTTPLILNQSMHVKSRAIDGTNWSALNEASFVVAQTFTNLLLTEIMYHPAPEETIDGDAFEFIELKSVSPTNLDLSGVHFTDGIDYTFPLGTRVAPGQFIILARNPTNFARRYPSVRLHGVYQGSLANNGETLALAHATGTNILWLSYGTKPPWPPSADGVGFSLVPVNPNLNPDPNDPVNWRASTSLGGSPGADDPPGSIAPILVNEILTHTDLPQKDAIELYNPTTQDVDLGYWYLTDARTSPKKFRIPAGTIVHSQGYLVFTEDQFQPSRDLETGFRLDSHGEEVYLYSADANGNLTGYSHGFSYGTAQNGVTFGRYVTSTGEAHYPPQLANTLGAPNAGPRVGPVVINEIHYHPPPLDDEFIELKNVTLNPIPLYDPSVPTNRWKLAGVGFDFPPQTLIPPRGLLLVVGTDPAAFRTKYNVPDGVLVLGPFSGGLQDNGERLQILCPDTPDIDTNGVVFVPYFVVDEVRYDNKAPWPTNAAGAGASLERIDPNAYGSDPINWRASFGTPSPGAENLGNRPPRVNAGIDLSLISPAFPVIVNLSGTATDDGLPNPPGSLTVAWAQTAGPGLVVFGDSSQLTTTASLPGTGTYVLRLTTNDGTAQSSDDLIIVVERPPVQVTFIPTGSVWKYLDDGSDLGTLWRTSRFNDSAWKSGKAQLGYGDGDEATTVGYGPDPNNKYVTTYFRRVFAVTNAAAVSALTVKLLRDDGAVVYLNGHEVFRSNMPESDVNYTTLASEVVSGADETSNYFEQAVDPTLLVEGTNLLAAEVHQANLTSTDLSFDLELSGLSQTANQAPVVNAGTAQQIVWPAAATLQGGFTDDGLPNPPGVVTIAWSKVSGPGEVTFANPTSPVTTASFSQPGTYVLRITARDGEFTSQAEVTITARTGTLEPPRFDSVSIADGTNHVLRLRFMGQANQSYTIEYRDSLSSGTWTKLADVPVLASSQPIEITDPALNNRPDRYYRIVSPARP
jgi:hypothetical protein